MLRSLFGRDWKNSPAHLLLLSKFLSPKAPADFAKKENWASLLEESPEKAIKRFLDDRMIELVSLEELLEYKCKVTELKKLLKQRGLSTSGNKDELVRRLVQSDPEDMRKEAAGLLVYKCTKAGEEIAKKYVTGENEKKEIIQRSVLDALNKRNFREAAKLVANYEASRLIPRGVNIDWKNYDTSRDIAMLTAIFERKPKMLAQLDDRQLEQLRTVAAMMYLWSYSYADYPLPPDFKTGLTIANDVAISMSLANVQFHNEIAECRKSQAEWKGVPHVIEIYNCNDNLVCSACKQIGRKYYSLKDVPELPYEKCTCEHGCRCWITWSTDITSSKT